MALSLQWRAVTGVSLLLLGGCVSLERTAPPVTAQMVGLAKPADAGRLEAGRRILVTSCVKCHTLEPLEKYSRAEWLESLADMSQRSKLTPEQETVLREYVMAARASRGLP